MNSFRLLSEFVSINLHRKRLFTRYNCFRLLSEFVSINTKKPASEQKNEFPSPFGVRIYKLRNGDVFIKFGAEFPSPFGVRIYK